MIKRLIALALGILCLVGSVISLMACAEKKDEEKPEDTAAPEENPLEKLEGLDFGGAKVNFIIAAADGDSFHTRSIYIEDTESEDPVDIEIYKRNAKIEQDLGVVINLVDDRDVNISTQIKAQLDAGTDKYDVIGARQYDDVQLALTGDMLDINRLAEYGADYIRWRNEYWGTSYIDALSFGDKVYWLAGDICLRYMGGYYAFFVNADLYRDKLFEKYGDIYDIVNSGKWTYDTLMAMLPLCYDDTNANERVDVNGDVLGLALPCWDNINGMSISAGVVYTAYDTAGMPYCTVNTKNNTLLEFMGKCYDLINKTKGVYDYGGDYQAAMRYFASDKAVFVAGRLNQAELYLSEMKTDYYVLPCPKLNEQQTSYYTAVHDAINIYGINIGSNQYQAAAATLEEMAYLSYTNVRPVYFESVLKYKYTRESQAVQMIQLMHDTVYTDFVFIWQFSDRFAENTGGGELGFYLRNAVKQKAVTSSLRKNQDRWKNAVDKIVEEIEELEY